MELCEIARALGIGAYPPVLDQIYANLSQENADICNIQRIAALQQELNLLGEHYDAVLDGIRALQQDPARLCWGQVVSTYLTNATLEEAQSVPLPVAKGDGDVLPLLVLLTQVPSAVEGYRSRGFSMDAIQEILSSFQDCVGRVRICTGVTGLDLRFYHWLCLYIKCRIFLFGGFMFEIASFSDNGCVVLKNRETGALVPLMHQVTLHKSGMILGSAGCEDPEGSRTVVFEETDDGFRGCPAIRGKASGPVTFYPKAQWSIALRPEDTVLSIHLPKGVDMTPQRLDSVFGDVPELVHRYYPEANIRAFHCGSWLLDPTLEEILGKDSKIAQYGARFARIPTKSDGREVYHFVFPPNTTDLNALPENTRLERSLKKLYLSGGYIHGFLGVFL